MFKKKLLLEINKLYLIKELNKVSVVIANVQML